MQTIKREKISIKILTSNVKGEQECIIPGHCKWERFKRREEGKMSQVVLGFKEVRPTIFGSVDI